MPATQPIPQQPHQPADIPQHHRKQRYPNGHLDPNINPNLPREQRNRNPPKRYNQHNELWTSNKQEKRVQRKRRRRAIEMEHK